MEPDLYHFSSLPVILLLVLTNGVFSVAEYALIRSQPVKLGTPEMLKRRGVEAALQLLTRLDLSLAVTQLWITLTTMLLGVVGVGFFSNLFQLTSERFFPFHIALIVSVMAAVLAISLLHLVVSQIAAKSLAIQNPEASLVVLAPFLRLLTNVCRPVLTIVNLAANICLRPFSATVPDGLEHFPSATELSILVSRSTEQGMFEKHEEQMLRGVFGFSHTIAREVMTPRTDLVTIRLDATFDEVLSTVIDAGCSRYPVVGKAIDDVKGILLAKDLLSFVPRATPADVPFQIEKLMRKPYFIPDTKPIDDLLNEFKRRKIHMAIVLDEHGGVDGLVTMEDLIEEIVGDIFDESDDQENVIQVQENGDLVVDGGMLVADLNQQVGLNIPEGDYDTIAGFIFTALGRMPKAGDEISVGPRGVKTDRPSSADIRIIGIGAIEENGSHETGEAATDGSARGEIIVIVEKVDNHRIESTRIKRIDSLKKPETDPASDASQP